MKRVERLSSVREMVDHLDSKDSLCGQPTPTILLFSSSLRIEAPDLPRMKQFACVCPARMEWTPTSDVVSQLLCASPHTYD